jgi:hypothetical protein
VQASSTDGRKFPDNGKKQLNGLVTTRIQSLEKSQKSRTRRNTGEGSDEKQATDSVAAKRFTARVHQIFLEQPRSVNGNTQ